MTDAEKIERIRELVAKTAALETCDERIEGWSPDDGGNFDDTYSAGVEDGEILMAREVMAVLGS